MSFKFSDVQEAYEKITPYIKQTPLEESFYLGDERQKYFFKLEIMQTVKSFKVRGAANKLLNLTDEEKARGICAISSGNHGSAVSYLSSVLGIKNVTVIVPETAPKSKIFKIQHFGATVLKMGKNPDEAENLGNVYIKQNNLVKIDSYYDDARIYAGQGTVAIEILRQNPEIDTIVVPAGGGSLITGCAVAAKGINPNVRVIGVQTENCPALKKSIDENHFYEKYPCESSLCDALIGGIGKLCFELSPKYVDDVITVTEESIGKAISFMARKEKYIIEAGSATTVAAVMEHRKKIGGKNVALIISGGNIDGDLLCKMMETYPDV